MIRENNFCIRYVFGSLKRARKENLLQDYIFYLRCKQLFSSSLIYKGNYLKTLSKALNLSETSVSVNISRLREKGFIYDMKKGKGFVLRPYEYVYRRKLKFSLSDIKSLTWRINKEKFESKRELLKSLEEIDVMYVAIELTKSLKTSKKYSRLSSGFNCLMTCDYIAKVVGRKSSKDGFDIYKRMVRSQIFSKEKVVERYIPETEMEEYLIRKHGGKIYYSLLKDCYYEQLPNLYTLTPHSSVRFTKHRESNIQASLVYNKHF